MNKTMTELKQELKDIQTGFEILEIRRSQTQIEIAQQENDLETVRALVMQTSIEAEHEYSLETQNWKDEQENIQEDIIQEVIQ